MRHRLSRTLPRRKIKVSREEWDKVRSDAFSAKRLIEDPEFSFFRDYLRNAQDSITSHFVQNKIKAVDEYIISDVLNRVLHITKKEQEDELSGQYKFIDKFLLDLKAIIELPKEYERALSEGKMEIVTDPNEEDDE